jgi:hypothetical protein
VKSRAQNCFKSGFNGKKENVMSRSQNLRHNVINQVINDMARGFIPRRCPRKARWRRCITSAAPRCAISSATYASAASEPGQSRLPDPSPAGVQDGFDGSSASLAEQNRLFEQAFFTMINQRQLRAGEIFSELQLARAAGVSPVVVREFLLKFSRYNLIESEKRGQWNMKKFEQSWAEQLFELREMLETHALQHFLNLPDTMPAGCRPKPCLSATAPCGTASATAFVCFPSSIVIFIRCCFPLLIIYFLINHLRLFP